MQPEQIEKAIDELWALSQNPRRPAAEIMNEYTRSRRYIGSKDRKAILNGVWARWRTLDYPAWLKEKINHWAAEWQAMQNAEAATVLRANGNRDEIARLLAAEGVHTTPTKLSPFGLVLDKRQNLQALETFKKGLIEVQDEGSQLLGLATQIKPNASVLELCAGAGGKSLLFAQMMQNKGKIVASDISPRSLKELEKRASRAHTSIIRTALQLPDEQFDYVVIDAPCSGTGTYRRAPDNVHKLTPEQFSKLLQTQSQLLDKAVRYVKPAGKICYMTCSLTRDENEAQIHAFLARHTAFCLELDQHFTPATTNTDGFYIALLRLD